MSKKSLSRFKKQSSLHDFWKQPPAIPASSKRALTPDERISSESLTKKFKQDSETSPVVQPPTSTEEKNMASRNSSNFPGTGHQLMPDSPRSPGRRHVDSHNETPSNDDYDPASIENGAYDERFVENHFADPSYSSSSQTEEQSMGTPIDELQRTPACLKGIHSEDLPSDLVQNNAHQRLSHRCTGVPVPEYLHDIWNTDHVKMPYSKNNLYSSKSKYNKVSRWDLIKEALGDRITNFEELKEAILLYNHLNKDKWEFDGLKSFFENINPRERFVFFDEVLPFMKKLVLDTEKIITEPPRLLKKGRPMSVSMSQNQAACLMANAFFCTFPNRNRSRDEYAHYPGVNFVNLFNPSHEDRKFEKLKCLFHYFNARRQLQADEINASNGLITFRRQIVKNPVDWKDSSQPLTRLHVSASGNIERDGEGMLQVDFANKLVGGGVLNRGLVQEEIRFIICPEMIISRLLTEELNDNECLIMTGCQCYSDSTGYSDSFKCLGPFDDKTERDSNGQLLTEVVAIDALVSRNYMDQFTPVHLKRELNKAYCGFMNPFIPMENLSAVATGNWGCGAFGGDVNLKAMTQMMSAAQAGRDVCYFTFNDSCLMRALHEMHTFLQEHKVTVGELYRILMAYHEENRRRHPQNDELYQFIHRKVTNEDIGMSNDNSPNYHEDTP